MKRIMINLVVVLAVGTFVTGVWACPGEATCSCPKAQNVAQSDTPSCGGGGAATVADAKSSCCGSCPSGCCGSVAKSCGDSCGKSCDKPCDHKSATLTSGKAGKSDCSGWKTTANEPSIEAVLASFPSMKYRVGDHFTGCSRTAESAAKKTGEPIHYLVGDSAFENPGQAKTKLAALLNQEIDSLKTVQYVASGNSYHCPKTANKVAGENGRKVAYRVGGFDFDSHDKADSVAKLVSDRLAEVKMTYKVGDQSFCCDQAAGMTAKKTGASLHYVVEGEETPCDKTAKLMLAEAMVRAAVLTAAAASSS